MVKGYQWKSQELQKKSKTYFNLMLVAMVVALACLFLLPQELKVLNFVFLFIGAVFWYMSYRIQSQDRKLGNTKR